MRYRSLHYFFSLFSKWHDARSNFSRLDHVFVLLLDQLAGTALVTGFFSFGIHVKLERFNCFANAEKAQMLS